MRNKRRSDEEWLSLIQQCRSSGFSDRVWCEQNDISINTFYDVRGKTINFFAPISIAP